METFIQTADLAFAEQLVIFGQKIGSHEGNLVLDHTKVLAVQADALYFRWVLDAANAYKTFSSSVINFKDILRRGKGGQALGTFPPLPALATAPAAVTVANAQKRFADLIQDCTRSSNFNQSIGEDLGILKPQTPFNPQDGKPEFHIEFSSGGHPMLVWIKFLFQGVEIWVNRGQGWVKLDTDFSPDYIDKFPLPAVDVSAIWKYKMIYLLEDEQVGSWSEDVPVTVTGTV